VNKVYGSISEAKSRDLDETEDEAEVSVLNYEWTFMSDEGL